MGTAEREPPGPSRITVLRAPGKRLTKTYTPSAGGKVVKRSYDNAKHFRTEVREFCGVDGLAGLLRELGARTDSCVIRAAPGRWHPGPGRDVRRLNSATVELVDARGKFHAVKREGEAKARQEADIAAERLFWVTALPMFEEAPTDWLLLDHDKLQAPAGIPWRDDLAWTAAYARLRLPAEFHACRCVYYATSSAADPSKPDLGGDTIKLRLGFVLDRGVTFAEAKKWLDGRVDDECTLRPVQVTYTAAPIFDGGLVDPLPVRLGMLDGERELVAVPAIEVSQAYRRDAGGSFGPVPSAEGLGLLPSPRLEAALERLAEAGGEAGSVRWGLMQCAFAYARDVGRDRVDVEVLATALAEAGRLYRNAAEVDAYGLADIVFWCIERTPPAPPPSPGLPPFFDGGEQDRNDASASLRLAVERWVREGLAYDGKGDPPRDAIAVTVGAGKTRVTLQVLADMARGRTVHFYTPTLELGAEVVTNAEAIGLPAVLVRGREENKKDPVRWPALCRKADVAAKVARAGRNVWESLCRKEDEFGNVTTCEFFHGCSYVAQFNHLEGKLIVLAHEYLTLPKTLIAAPALAVIDERFHATLIRTPTPSLPLERVSAQRVHPRGDGHFKQLTADARCAIKAVEAGQTMAEIGLTPERLREMARDEERLAEPPAIWPGLPYAEQRHRADQLAEMEAFRLGKMWRTLAKDHDRISQRVVVQRGIGWHGELQDRVFVYSAKTPVLPKKLPVLLLDADHDPLIGAATLATNRRTEIRPRLNAEVIQVRDTVCSRRKLLQTGSRREQVLTLARHEAAQGRKVLIGTYKPVADLLRQELAELGETEIEIAHFNAIRGLDRWKSFDTVIIAGREQSKPLDVESMARSLFGGDAEPLLLAGEYVQMTRGHRTKDGTRTAVTVQVHPDLRVQALVEQVREREVEQMVGRLRLVHRERPARVLLLTNLPTALPIDRFTTWEEVMPNKIDQAIVAGRGVLPLTASELARAHPGLWPTTKAAEHWLARKCPQKPLRYSYREMGALSAATLVKYRRPGQARGRPQQAIIPRAVTSPDAAAALLEPLLGPVEAVSIVEVITRPTTAAEAPPRPAVAPEPTPRPTAVIEDAGEPADAFEIGPPRAARRPASQVHFHYFSFGVLPRPASRPPAGAEDVRAADTFASSTTANCSSCYRVRPLDADRLCAGCVAGERMFTAAEPKAPPESRPLSKPWF